MNSNNNAQHWLVLTTTDSLLQTFASDNLSCFFFFFQLHLLLVYFSFLWEIHSASELRVSTKHETDDVIRHASALITLHSWNLGTSHAQNSELDVSAVKFTRGQLCCFGEKIWPQSLPADLAKMLEGSRFAISQILCNKRNTIWFENFSLKLSLQKKQTNNNKTQPLMTRFGKSFLLFWISCYKRNI